MAPKPLVTSVRPSGLNATTEGVLAWIGRGFPSFLGCAGALTSHSWIALSVLALAIIRPSGLNTMEETGRSPSSRLLDSGVFSVPADVTLYPASAACGTQQG